MKRMASIFGQPCYALASDMVQVYLTVQGGHMTAEFKGKGEALAPFHTTPWWREPYMEDADWIMRVLRGDFFCLPFGSNVEPVGGRKYLLHGQRPRHRRARRGGDHRLFLDGDQAEH